MPKFDLKSINVKATDVMGQINVLELPVEGKRDKNSGEVVYPAIVVFEGEKDKPVRIKLAVMPKGINEYDAVELHGLVIDAWAQASGGNYANINWRAEAIEMTKAGIPATSRAFETSKGTGGNLGQQGSSQNK